MLRIQRRCINSSVLRVGGLPRETAGPILRGEARSRTLQEGPSVDLHFRVRWMLVRLSVCAAKIICAQHQHSVVEYIALATGVCVRLFVDCRDKTSWSRTTLSCAYAIACAYGAHVFWTFNPAVRIRLSCAKDRCSSLARSCSAGMSCVVVRQFVIFLLRTFVRAEAFVLNLSSGERRSMLNACTLRYQAYCEVAQIWCQLAQPCPF